MLVFFAPKIRRTSFGRAGFAALPACLIRLDIRINAARPPRRVTPPSTPCERHFFTFALERETLSSSLSLELVQWTETEGEAMKGSLSAAVVGLLCLLCLLASAAAKKCK